MARKQRTSKADGSSGQTNSKTNPKTRRGRPKKDDEKVKEPVVETQSTDDAATKTKDEAEVSTDVNNCVENCAEDEKETCDKCSDEATAKPQHFRTDSNNRDLEEVATRQGDGRQGNVKPAQKDRFVDRHVLGEGYITFNNVPGKAESVGLRRVRDQHSPVALDIPEGLDFVNSPKYRIVIERIK